MLSFIKNILFPPICAGCSTLGSYLCSACVETAQEFVVYESAQTASANKLPDNITCIYLFSGSIAKLITQIKYGFYTCYEASLLECMYAALTEAPWVDKPCVLVPIPLHAKRYRWRGFNQSQHLAEGLARYLHVSTYPLLLKHRHTNSQADLDRQARLDNLQGCFSWNSHFDPKLFATIPIVLIDDVYTTGTTISLAEQCLREQGIQQVHGLCVARAEE